MISDKISYLFKNLQLIKVVQNKLAQMLKTKIISRSLLKGCSRMVSAREIKSVGI